MLLLAAFASQVSAEVAPVCPGSDAGPQPPFAPAGEPPNVASWPDLQSLPDGCHLTLRTPADLTLALSGRFRYAGSATALAARLGAISATTGLPYWSVTDGDWRPLITEAFAVADADSETPRPDFTAREIMSGQTLYFAQNDSRSWGLNIHSVRAIEASPERLVFVSENTSAIRLGPVTLFAPHAVRTVHFLARQDAHTWTYFGLSAIQGGRLRSHESSLVNRQAAFYRWLIGEPPDKRPPLAP